MQPDICSRKSHNEPHSFLANLAIAGHKQSLRERIYVSLRDDGAQSCEQLSLRLGIRYTSVSARLSELKSMVWVVRTGEDRETTGGTRAGVVRHLTASEREDMLHPKRGYSERQGKLFDAQV